MSLSGVAVLSLSDLAPLPQPVGQVTAARAGAAVAAAAGTAPAASTTPASATVAQIVLA
ncbi:hypothetical protein GCM10010293_46720 [Streptomyces griseoflavus]|nr:hypothetical protein GCM10010293_46720 [Streptomyces griseoflavus]